MKINFKLLVRLVDFYEIPDDAIIDLDEDESGVQSARAAWKQDGAEIVVYVAVRAGDAGGEGND